MLHDIPGPLATAALAAYRPPPGAADELLDGEGRIRPVWRPFIEHFARLTPDEIARRFARGDQYLRDAGVFYRQYGTEGPSERAWPLAHIPVLVEEEEAARVARGLIQRADLLEAVLADLYGPNRLVADGYLPARLVAGSREWLRPLVGVAPRRGHYLHFIAFEIGRGPDGSWWVLGDRTQAPSGAGFALENRVATSRVFSDLFARTLAIAPTVQETMHRNLERRLRIVWDDLHIPTLVRELPVAALVIHDRDDADVPFRHGEEIVGAWAGSRLETTTGLGHRALLRDPSVIARAVGFLAEDGPE